MPTYVYACRKCEAQFEVMQRITEDALTVHEDCGGELKRILHPVGIVFKGPGFYVNDYGRGNKNGNGKPNGTSAEKPEPASEKTETKPAAATETKASDAKPAAPSTK